MSGGIGDQSKEFGIKQVWVRMCDFDELHNHFETNTKRDTVKRYCIDQLISSQ